MQARAPTPALSGPAGLPRGQTRFPAGGGLGRIPGYRERACEVPAHLTFCRPPGCCERGCLQAREGARTRGEAVEGSGLSFWGWQGSGLLEEGGGRRTEVRARSWFLGSQHFMPSLYLAANSVGRTTPHTS